MVFISRGLNISFITFLYAFVYLGRVQCKNSTLVSMPYRTFCYTSVCDHRLWIRSVKKLRDKFTTLFKVRVSLWFLFS